MIILLSGILVSSYCIQPRVVQYILLIGGGATLLGILFSCYVIPFDVAYLQYGLCVALVVWLILLYLCERMSNYFYIALFVIGSAVFFFSTDYVFNRILEPHQKIRIEVLLGMEDDPTGAGYNVNQSKIAIGSGGLLGKGFLNGTQTKLKYVPEQDTDFIFCTVGEEWGFVGTMVVLALLCLLILRLMRMGERQQEPFGRIYCYCVAAILLFHVLVNVGMTIGLMPVMGIPLPFMSYGGSSLIAFTILLFIAVRLDASTRQFSLNNKF